MNNLADSNASPTLTGSEALTLLQQISTWGNTTTIILHGGCVFEFKGEFPTGEIAEGYYNLKGKTGFEGHLNLDAIKTIHFQSKNHRGRESHALIFTDKNGDAILELLLELHQERQTTLLLVTHSEELASRADRIITLQDGRVVSDVKKTV